MATFKLLLFPGDGIGPEVMAELEKITDHFNREGVAKFEIEKGLVGGGAYDTHGKAISDADMALAADQAFFDLEFGDALAFEAIDNLLDFGHNLGANAVARKEEEFESRHVRSRCVRGKRGHVLDDFPAVRKAEAVRPTFAVGD